jgi:hypothetical protein
MKPANHSHSFVTGDHIKGRRNSQHLSPRPRTGLLGLVSPNFVMTIIELAVWHLALAFIAGVAVGMLVPYLRRPFRQYATVEDLPKVLFDKGRCVRGKVVAVSDGDTFRVRHLPWWYDILYRIHRAMDR